MQKLKEIKKDSKIIEIMNTNALKGGCSCGDKRPRPTPIPPGTGNGGNSNWNGNWNG